MDNMNPTMGAPAPHSKAHVWILVLLVWAVALSLVTIGLLVTRGGKNAASAEEMAIACQNGTTNAVNSSLDRLADACASAEPGKADEAEGGEEVESLPYTGTNSNNMLPKVSYPLGWSAMQHWADTSTFQAHPEYFFSCEACGGMTLSSGLTIWGKPVAEAEEMDKAKLEAKFIEDSKAADAEYTNISIATSSNGSRVDISGHAKLDAAGGGDYDFHEIRYKTANTYVKVLFIDIEENLDAEWEMIKDSLEFSIVK